MRSRALVALLVFVSLMPVWAWSQGADQPPVVEVSHLTGNLNQLLCHGNVGVVAFIGEDGTLLVDTGYTSSASAVVEELASLGSSSVQIIVNTHSDLDHVGGNPVLASGATVIAHPYVRRSMSTYFALPAVDSPGLPIVTLESETTIHFNDEVIRLLPVPGGHNGGDVVVHFTHNRIACVGDLVLVGTFPNADPGRGGDAQRLVEVLKGLKEQLPADTTLLASHGGAFTMAELETYIGMVKGTIAAVAAEIDAGRTLTEIVEMNPLAPWAEWERPEVGLSFENWITEIHASLTSAYVESIAAPMTEALVTGGADAAVARYRQLKVAEPDGWKFGQRELNVLGYQLLARERFDDAIAIFKLNIEVFPDEFNPYDSLGEAYMRAGRTEQAIANYERSLELNPDNTNAVRMLAQIREE